MHNHFKTQITESYSKAPSTKIRWEKSLTFVGDLNNVISALDVGDVTGLTKMMENKLLILPSGDQAIRFRPHLNVTQADLSTALDIINSTIKSALN